LTRPNTCCGICCLQDIRKLDNISFEDWFKSHGGSDASIKRMWDPIGEQQEVKGFVF
jgi:uncharacterized protein with NAD-binding domain and iron-sulfur cluster